MGKVGTGGLERKLKIGGIQRWSDLIKTASRKYEAFWYHPHNLLCYHHLGRYLRPVFLSRDSFFFLDIYLKSKFDVITVDGDRGSFVFSTRSHKNKHYN